MTHIHMSFYKFLYRTLNIATLPIALYLALSMRSGSWSILQLDSSINVLFIYSVVSWIGATSFFQYYEQSWHSRSAKTVIRTTNVAILFFAFLGMVSFFLKDYDYSRMVIVLFVGFQWAFALAAHHIILFYSTRQESFFRRSRNLLIIGNEESAKQVLEEIEMHPHWGVNLVGYICDENGASTSTPYLGSLDKLRHLITTKSLQEVIVTLPIETHTAEIMEALNVAEDEGIRSQIVPQNLNQFNLPLKLSFFGSIITYRIRHIPLDNFYQRMQKRLFDLFFASIGVVLLSPILIPVIIAIKLADGGPVFFKQKRTGYDQNEFLCLKFRSMTVKDLGISTTTQPGADDPRLLKLKLGFLPEFPLGKFLRKSNIDELPQLLNVIRGEMSLVGPRPHMVEHTEEFRERVNKYMIRHFVRPGITGLAQVNGYRGKTDTQAKLEGRVHYDIKYIETWTLLLDFKIILDTLFSKKAKEKDL